MAQSGRKHLKDKLAKANFLEDDKTESRPESILKSPPESGRKHSKGRLAKVNFLEDDEIKSRCAFSSGSNRDLKNQYVELDFTEKSMAKSGRDNPQYKAERKRREDELAVLNLLEDDKTETRSSVKSPSEAARKRFLKDKFDTLERITDEIIAQAGDDKVYKAECRFLENMLADLKLLEGDKTESKRSESSESPSEIARKRALAFMEYTPGKSRGSDSGDAILPKDVGKSLEDDLDKFNFIEDYISALKIEKSTSSRDESAAKHMKDELVKLKILEDTKSKDSDSGSSNPDPILESNSMEAARKRVKISLDKLKLLEDITVKPKGSNSSIDPPGRWDLDAPKYHQLDIYIRMGGSIFTSKCDCYKWKNVKPKAAAVVAYHLFDKLKNLHGLRSVVADLLYNDHYFFDVSQLTGRTPSAMSILCHPIMMKVPFDTCYKNKVEGSFEIQSDSKLVPFTYQILIECCTERPESSESFKKSVENYDNWIEVMSTVDRTYKKNYFSAPAVCEAIGNYDFSKILNEVEDKKCCDDCRSRKENLSKLGYVVM